MVRCMPSSSAGLITASASCTVTAQFTPAKMQNVLSAAAKAKVRSHHCWHSRPSALSATSAEDRTQDVSVRIQVSTPDVTYQPLWSMRPSCHIRQLESFPAVQGSLISYCITKRWMLRLFRAHRLYGIYYHSVRLKTVYVLTICCHGASVTVSTEGFVARKYRHFI